jgi:undecaprenyl-diphosphatase
MQMTQAVVLGAIQGLTEFFPVSSSGHLVIFQQMMGLREPVLMFDISVHVGTLAAIFVYYFADILRIFTALIRPVASLKTRDAQALPTDGADRRLVWLIVVGSVPTAVIGFGLSRISHVLFSSLVVVGISLLITGALVLATRWIGRKPDSGQGFSFWRAVVVGTVQGLAVIPGISRSGSTIVMGLVLGVDREKAVRFSFLLSMPAIIGALVLQLVGESAGAGPVSAGVMAVGTITSFAVGYVALCLLVKLVQKGRLHVFAPYCFLLGGVAVIAGM